MHCTVASLTQRSHPRKASASALAVTVTVAVAGPRRISTGQKANPVAWGLDYESFFFTSRLGIETCGALSTSWFHMEEITTSHGWKPANNGIDQLVQDFATIHCEEQIWKLLFLYMGVPHWSSILIGLCIINHPFFGRFPILGNPHFSDPIQSKSSGSARDGTKLHAWLLSSRPLGASTMFWCAKKGWRKVEYAGRIIYIYYIHILYWNFGLNDLSIFWGVTMSGEILKSLSTMLTRCADVYLPSAILVICLEIHRFYVDSYVVMSTHMKTKEYTIHFIVFKVEQWGLFVQMNLCGQEILLKVNSETSPDLVIRAEGTLFLPVCNAPHTTTGLSYYCN